jgi:hypothetical protein
MSEAFDKYWYKELVRNDCFVVVTMTDSKSTKWSLSAWSLVFPRHLTHYGQTFSVIDWKGKYIISLCEQFTKHVPKHDGQNRLRFLMLE